MSLIIGLFASAEWGHFGVQNTRTHKYTDTHTFTNRTPTHVNTLIYTLAHTHESTHIHHDRRIMAESLNLFCNNEIPVRSHCVA